MSTTDKNGLPDIDAESRPPAPAMKPPRVEERVPAPQSNDDPLPHYQDNEEPDQPWVTDDEAGALLNTRWRAVIKHRMAGKTLVEAYGIAYDIDITKTQLEYNKAAANASRLIRNAKFQALWDRINLESGFSDQMADSQLLDLMTNIATEPTVRLGALSLYSKLRGRQIDRVDHTTKGKAIETPAIISAIKPRDETAAQTEAADGN